MWSASKRSLRDCQVPFDGAVPLWTIPPTCGGYNLIANERQRRRDNEIVCPPNLGEPSDTAAARMPQERTQPRPARRSRTLCEMKRGELHSGRSGRKVKS